MNRPNDIMKKLVWAVMLPTFAICVRGQTISSAIPKNADASAKFVFYLHGAVVTELGDNAINQSVPEWGPYEYSKILDSLRSRGFNVISEIRKKGVPDAQYADKIVKQIDSLRQKGVAPRNILVLGASAGWNIALLVSATMKNKQIRYVVMGGCWPETYKDYTNIRLFGHFLSIIETTDPHGTCVKIFEARKTISNFKEIKLNTGLSHGFIYKGYADWIDPVVSWFNN